MGLINLRDLVAFPGGDNSTDTIIHGIHFNKTALDHWNYTLYSNNTLSNNSACYLIFDQYQPHILDNGTWVNATSCYAPVNGIAARGKLDIGFAAFFAASIMFTLINLRKHGQQFLREESRFRIVGRRWQWYWMLIIAGCGIISCICGIDVDRDYLQQIAIILQCLFFYLMLPCTMACVWEATRHWGSWEERQLFDVDPFANRTDDRRSKAEFYMPLAFYFFAFFNFFMTVPRSWTKIQYQRSYQQQIAIAEPAATDGRFKAAGFLGALAYFVIIYNLNHNIYYYRPRAVGLFSQAFNVARQAPLRLVLAILVLGVSIGYAIAASFIFSITLMKYNGDTALPYALGYGPPAAIIFLFNIWGYIDPNEDMALIKQRRIRGAASDAELGITKKPHWWSKMRGDAHLTSEQRMFREVGGGNPTNARIAQNLELQRLHRDSYVQQQTGKYSDNPHNPRVDRAGALSSSVTPLCAGLRDRSASRGAPGSDANRDPSPAYSSDAEAPLTGRGRGLEVRPAVGREMSSVSAMSDGSAMTGTTLSGQPQRIRSMLDI